MTYVCEFREFRLMPQDWYLPLELIILILCVLLVVDSLWKC